MLRPSGENFWWGFLRKLENLGHADHERWLLAYLIDWHRREEKAGWWEFFSCGNFPGSCSTALKRWRRLVHVAEVGPVLSRRVKPQLEVAISPVPIPPKSCIEKGGDEVRRQDGKPLAKS